MQTILDFIFSRPGRCKEIGILIFQFGSYIGIIGGVCKVVTTAANTSLITVSTKPEKQLADVITAFPTFWIPESLEGFGMIGCIIAIGLTIAWIGYDVDRALWR